MKNLCSIRVQNIETKRVLVFFATLPLVDIFVGHGGKPFFSKKFMMATPAKQRRNVEKTREM